MRWVVLRRCRGVVLLALMVAALCTTATAGTTVISSTSNGRTPRKGDSSDPIMTPDGRFVVFTSLAEDLLLGLGLGDGNGTAAGDIFIRDVPGKSTTLVSVNKTGTASGDGPSDSPSLTADGSAVAFASMAGNLVAGFVDGNGPAGADIFMRDLTHKTTTLVSVNSDATASGNGGASNPVITPDGRYVAFVSSASDLVATDTNNATDVFVRDLSLRTTTLVSVNGAGTDSGSGHSSALSSPAITPDGRYVAFASLASDLVPNDTNGTQDIFVRDLVAGTTTLVSVNSAGTGSGNAASLSTPAISADGRFVAFASNASDLVPQDTNGTTDVFVRDMVAGTTTLVSVNGAGTDSGNGDSGFLSLVLTPNGRFVAFESNASDLVPADNNSATDVFVRDLTTQATVVVSVNALGTDTGNDISFFPALSPDGRYVGFTSNASDLVANDSNGTTDVFLRDLLLGTTRLASANRLANESGNGTSNAPVNLSSDGQFVAFASAANDLVANDQNHAVDVFGVGLTLTVRDFAVLRWPAPPPTAHPDIRVVADHSTSIRGTVCADDFALVSYTRIRGDLIALNASGNGVTFVHAENIAGNVVTGGVPVVGFGNARVGGRLDTSGTGPELQACLTAADLVGAKHTQLLALPSTRSLAAVAVPNSGRVRIPAVGTLGPGQSIVDIPSVRLGKYGLMSLVGDSTTTQVIVRVTGSTAALSMESSSRIALRGLRPEQVLFLVDGPVTLSGYNRVAGNLLVAGPINVQHSCHFDGSLLASGAVTIGPYSSISLRPFAGF